MSKSLVSVPDEIVENSILLIRGQKVILDRDLARLFGVEARALNQSVKRNLDRFPRGLYVSTNTRGDQSVVKGDCARTFKITKCDLKEC